jgi:hypothetical protein
MSYHVVNREFYMVSKSLTTRYQWFFCQFGHQQAFTKSNLLSLPSQIVSEAFLYHLITHGIDYTTDDYFLLHFSCEVGYTSVVQVLLQCKRIPQRSQENALCVVRIKSP